MRLLPKWRPALAAATLACALPALAASPKIGIAVLVEGDGFFLNPVITKVRMANVEKGSIAEAAGIVAGDEIEQIEGRSIGGKRASELRPYMTLNPGETRTLRLRHANGEPFDARLTRPPE